MGRKSFNECSLIDKLPVMGERRLRLSLAIVGGMLMDGSAAAGSVEGFRRGDDAAGAPVPRRAVTRPWADPLQPAESRGVWPGSPDRRPCQVDG